MPNMDVLRALDELKDAGVEERSARAMIRLVSEAVELQAVTKPDLERECTAIRATLAQSTTELRGEIAETAVGLRGEIAQATAALRSEIAEMAAGLRRDMAQATAALRSEMAETAAGLRGELGELRGEVGGTAWRGR